MTTDPQALFRLLLRFGRLTTEGKYLVSHGRHADIQMRRAPDLRVASASVTGRGEDPHESRLIVDNAVAHLAGVLVQLPGNWRAVPACSGHADHERLTACAHGDGQHGEQIPRVLHVDLVERTAA
jgi:hypothetical protein